MSNIEKESSIEADWVRIQRNTFTRWANKHLQQSGMNVSNLETDFCDGVKLIALIEKLSNGKRILRFNKIAKLRYQKLENVSLALTFLHQEGIALVNIGAIDIVDSKLKLILGLMWTLILHYTITAIPNVSDALGVKEMIDQDKRSISKRNLMLNWVKEKILECPINNFTSDWKDGKALGALVDSVAPGLCPNWKDWDPDKHIENLSEAMELADKWLNVSIFLTPDEMVNPNVDECSMMTYLSQFPNVKIKPQLQQPFNTLKTNSEIPPEPSNLNMNQYKTNNFLVFGPGLKKGVVKKPAKFVAYSCVESAVLDFSIEGPSQILLKQQGMIL